MYRNYFPLMALGRFRARLNEASGGNGQFLSRKNQIPRLPLDGGDSHRVVAKNPMAWAEAE
jgi:hypothetical protein